MTDTYQSLKFKCEQAGTNLTEVCRLAGVDRSTVERWKKKEPNSVVIIKSLEAAIENIKAGQHATAKAVSV